MPQKRYIVRLTAQEREICQQTVRKLNSSEKVRRAQILLKACGRAGVDRPAGRRGLFVPHQDGREHSPTLRAGRVRAGAGTKTAGVAPGPQTARRRTGVPGHRPASGAAPEGLCELVVAPVGARVVELAIVESISHETIRRTLKKTVIPPQADAEFVANRTATCKATLGLRLSSVLRFSG